MTNDVTGAGASTSRARRQQHEVEQPQPQPRPQPQVQVPAQGAPVIPPAVPPGPELPAAAVQDAAPAQHRRAAWAGRALSERRGWPAVLTTPLSSHMTQLPTRPRVPVAPRWAPEPPLPEGPSPQQQVQAQQRATQRAQQRLNQHLAQVDGNDAAQRAAHRLKEVATIFGGQQRGQALTETAESILAPGPAAQQLIQRLAGSLFPAQAAQAICQLLQAVPPADGQGVPQTSPQAASQLLLYALSAQGAGASAPAVLQAFLDGAQPPDGQTHSLVHGTPAGAVAGSVPATETTALLGVPVAPAPQRQAQVAAFNLACALAASGPGFDVLHGQMPELHDADDPPYSALLRKEAVRQAFHAAAPLQAALQRAGLAVASLEELRLACAELLPQSLGGNAPARPQANDHTRALRKETLAAKAYIAAMTLAAHPHADLLPSQKDAYFSFRNGFRHEGKGTPLYQAQHRLFKMTTYLQRASDNAQNGRARALWQGVRQSLGKHKSPLDAMAWGTGGARLRAAPQDFGKATRGIAAVRTALQAQLPGAATGAQAQGLHLRLAALDAYERILVTKGWRDEVSLGRSGVHQVVQQAAAAAGRPAAALAAHAEAQALLHTAITPELLAGWTPPGDEPAQQAVQVMRSMLNHGDPEAQPIGTPDDVYSQLRSVARDAFPTFDVKHQGGGREGLNYRTSLLSKSKALARWATRHDGPLPAANFAARVTHARVALVDAGSSSHGGTLFVGSDRRLGAGLGVDVGVYGRKGALWGGLGKGVGFAYEGAHARGVMLRTRIFTRMEGEPPFDRREEDADAASVPLWRAKMLSAMDVIARDGPGAGPWPTPQEMWSALAGQFHQDLDVSINAINLGSRAATRTSPTAAVMGAGGQADPVPAFSLPVMSYTSVSTWLTSRRTETGSFEVDTVVSQHNLSKVVSAGLTGRLPLDAAPDLAVSGHTLADVAAGAPLLGASMPVQEHHVNVRLRLAQQDGRIESAMTYLDTEFGSVDDYRAYLESREQVARASATPQQTPEELRNNPAWSTSLPGGAAQPQDAARGREALLQHLDEQTGEADRSGQFFCERRQLRPEAARQIDELRALRQAVMDSALSAPMKKQESRALDAAVTTLIEADSSWGNRFLFTMEQNGSLRALGPAAVVQLENVQAVQHLHLTHVVKAAENTT